MMTTWIPLAALVLLTTAGPAADTGLATTYTLLIGHPEARTEPSGTVLIVPGTLIPALEGPGELSEKLREAYRLKGVTVEAQYMKRMEPGRTVSMPSPAPGIEVRMTLIGNNESVATYRVEMIDGGEVLADTPVSIRRGGRAVVGSRNGEAAPYVFIVIGTAGDEEAAEKSPSGEAPRIVERINPRYPEQARKNGIQGEVTLKAVVDKNGGCSVIEILESPDPLLSEAAREAVEQWKYEPARDAAGRVADAEMSITVRFRLE
jgi:protein TonB